MRLIGYGMVTLLVLLALYIGTYYAMVDRDLDRYLAIVPTYRFGGEASENLFSLWHEYDRRIRPEYWSLTSFVKGWR